MTRIAKRIPFLLGACWIGMVSCDENNKTGVSAPACDIVEPGGCIQQLTAATDSMHDCWAHYSECPSSSSQCVTVQADGDTCRWPDGAKLTGFSRLDLSLVAADGTECYRSGYDAPTIQVITIRGKKFRYVIEGDIRTNGTLTIECPDGSKSGPYSLAEMGACSASATSSESAEATSAPSKRSLYCCSETSPPSCPKPITVAQTPEQQSSEAATVPTASPKRPSTAMERILQTLR